MVEALNKIKRGKAEVERVGVIAKDGRGDEGIITRRKIWKRCEGSGQYGGRTGGGGCGGGSRGDEGVGRASLMTLAR